MNWKLVAHRARKAYVRDYGKRTMESMAHDGYDTAAMITATQEALVIGLGTLAMHETRRDSKRVKDNDWRELK